MVIDNNIKKYIRYYEESIRDAVRHLTDMKGAIICAVNEHNILMGVFTRGDLMRWMISQEFVDLNSPLSSVMNSRYLFARENDTVERIESLLEKVALIPIVDDGNRLVGVARKRDNTIQIADRSISQNSPSFIIAEIGNNHNGSFETAKKLVDASVEAGADCAKFQMRHLPSLYSNAGDPNDSRENLGSQYTLDLLSRFELPPEQMIELFDYCKEKGVIPLCTAWDEHSLRILETYGMEAYKLASADLTNHQLLETLIKTKKPLICSTGMSDESEIKDSIALLKRGGIQYVLLQCNSTYPAPYKDVNLKYMERLGQLGNCLVGYSGHERGFHIPVAAVALGARVIEKHITLNKSMEGNDHKVSLLPNEFRDMVTSIRELEEALGSDAPRKMTQGEMMNREVLAKSLIAAQNIPRGKMIQESMLEIKSPGRGLQPNRMNELVGKVIHRDMKRGDFFYENDLQENKVESRDYHFDRKWGVPVRYHDFEKMLASTNMTLVEFHLSYKDMDLNPTDFFSKKSYDLELVVHSPELFSGDHIMDLCTDDLEYREQSIRELQRVVDITRGLKKFFPQTLTPLIIINAGGFTAHDFLPVEERKRMYNNLKESLAKIDSNGVEIIPQTMPPFPWHFGGQRYHNLFLDPDETSEFCKEHNMRICFDISHSKLACNYFNLSFKEFVKKVGPFTAHMHVVDAKGVDGEGLQIGDGEIDFSSLADDLNQYLVGDVSFIPEIWQGHENEGEGFWVALSRLEGKF